MKVKIKMKSLKDGSPIDKPEAMEELRNYYAPKKDKDQYKAPKLKMKIIRGGPTVKKNGGMKKDASEYEILGGDADVKFAEMPEENKSMPKNTVYKGPGRAAGFNQRRTDGPGKITYRLLKKNKSLPKDFNDMLLRESMSDGDMLEAIKRMRLENKKVFKK